MKLEVIAHTENSTTYKVYGSIDYDDVKDMGELLNCQTEELILNLHDCTHFDSSGLGLLIKVHRIRMENNKYLILRCVSPYLMEKLTIQGLNRVFRIYTA